MKLGRPCLADELIGRKAFEGFEPSSKVIGGDEARKVLSELVMALVAIRIYLASAFSTSRITTSMRRIPSIVVSSPLRR